MTGGAAVANAGSGLAPSLTIDSADGSIATGRGVARCITAIASAGARWVSGVSAGAGSSTTGADSIALSTAGSVSTTPSSDDSEPSPEVNSRRCTACSFRGFGRPTSSPAGA